MPTLLRTTTLRALLRAGADAVPAARLAIGVVGLAAAAALAVRGGGPLIAVLGGAIVVAGMVLLVVVARLTALHDAALHAWLVGPALVLAWTVVAATVVVIALMISITFWAEPTSWHDVAGRAHPDSGARLISPHGPDSVLRPRGASTPRPCATDHASGSAC